MALDPPQANLVSLRNARDEAITRLSDAFAHDLIGIDEFERRLTLVHRAATVSEIAGTIADLGSASTTALATISASPVAFAGHVNETDRVMAVMGVVQRHGPWNIPRHLRAVAIMGAMVLDLREACFPRGITEIDLTVVLGGAQIIVPPGLAVEVLGTAIAGGVDHIDRMPAQLDPERPMLRVRGFALLGGIAVETRLPGESEMDAHRRRARGRKAIGPPREPKQLPEKT